MSLTRTTVRGVLGLVAGLVAGLGLFVWLSHEAQKAEYGARMDRLAVVRARMIADLVVRAGGFGDASRAAVTRAAAADPGVAAVRVVRLGGAVLEASTVAADSGERAAPRRLELSEKWIYDLGQELHAARATNREEGSTRKAEIVIARDPEGWRRAAAPIEIDGSVEGLALVQTPGEPPAPATPLLPAAVACVTAVLLFLLSSGVARNSRWGTALLASLVLAAALGAATWFTTRTITDAGRRTARAVVDLTARQATVARAALPGDARPYDLASWDVDPFGRPRGLVQPDGSASAAAVTFGALQARQWLLRRAVAIGIAALLPLLGMALGLAARVAATLRKHRQAYTYAAPAVVAMLVLVFIPFLYGIVLSFTDANIYNSNAPIADIWVGLRNFRDILTDVAISRETASGRVFNYQNFYWTLGFSIVWTVTNVAIGVTVGLALALALNTAGLRFRPIYRVLLIMPWAVPNYITALIWRGMFHKQFGIVNQVLLMVGGDSISWFEHPLTSFTAIVATNGWLSFPFMMVISLGALQSISGELYEAARVDGASRWQQFTSITLPSLKPALVPAVIISVIWTFNMFNIPYLVSAGEPAHATEILITQAYKVAFEQYRYGYAAAYSTIIFVILLAYGTWQNRVSRAAEAL
jgi:arabinogalactan oligomer / maltooligosaccharide transport system permease protein